MAFDEKQGQPAGFRQSVLDLRPGRRRGFAVFLRNQGIGGLSWHLPGHPAGCGYTQLRIQLEVAGRTLASIDFKCVTYKDLGAGSLRTELPSSAHEEFTLVLNN